MKLNILWVVVLKLVVPSCQEEEQCDGPICYAVNVVDATNQHVFKIDCKDALKYIPAKIIRYRCVSDISLGDLMNGIGPLYVSSSEDKGSSSSDTNLSAPPPVDEGSGLEPFSSESPREEDESTSGPTSSAQPTRPFNAITCLTNSLPEVQNGYFDCRNSYDVSMGDACNLVCNNGFYVGSSNSQVLCEVKASEEGARWSDTNLTCHAITCQKSSLPPVQAGFFNCSGYSVGEKCNLTCSDGNYPSGSLEIVCGEKADSKGTWTDGNFQCTAITCQKSSLPVVQAGSFNCSGYSVGEKCNLTCDDGYYPSELPEIVCEELPDFRGNWTDGKFQCSANFKRQFVFSFLRITGCPKPDNIVQLFIATAADNVGAEGAISFPLQNIPAISFTLSPGVGEFFNLSPLILPGDSDDPASRKENSSVVVVATDVVLVYGHTRCIDTGIKRSTAFKIRGINELGKDYRVVTYRNMGYTQIGVVALEDDTLIQVINKTGSTKNANITLQMYETYVTGGKFDMTGTYIKASATVFVLTGNKGDRSPNTPSGGVPFYECLIPFSNWGTHYYIFPPFMTSWTAIKIISWENKNASVVEWKNGKQLSSPALESSTIFEASRELGKIKSSKPILVAQFEGPTKLRNENKIALAISMLLVPAIPQFTLNYIVFPVFKLTLSDYAAEHYINVFLSAGGHANDLYINKATTTWQVIGNYRDGNAIFRTNLSPGSNLLENRGRYNATAVVAASQDVRCYTFALL